MRASVQFAPEMEWSPLNGLLGRPTKFITQAIPINFFLTIPTCPKVLRGHPPPIGIVYSDSGSHMSQFISISQKEAM